MSNPFSQARQLMQLAEDQDLDVGELQVLYNSGHLSRLFRAAKYGNISQVNVEELERILGLDLSIFKVRIGESETTNEIVVYLKANGFNYVNDCITQANFPLVARPAIEEDEVVIHDPDCSFSENEGLAILKQEGLLRPTYEHALRFAREYGMITTSAEKPFIVFLHEPWQDTYRYRRVVCLNRRFGYRELSLNPAGSRFNDNCVVAGVCPRKQSSAT